MIDHEASPKQTCMVGKFPVCSGKSALKGHTIVVARLLPHIPLTHAVKASSSRLCGHSFKRVRQDLHTCASIPNKLLSKWGHEKKQYQHNHTDSQERTLTYVQFGLAADKYAGDAATQLLCIKAVCINS